MKLKRCSGCNTILTTEQYNKGFDYCYDCYKLNHESSGNYSSTYSLKRCKLCNEILTTEEYKNGYDYHLACYLIIKGKKNY